MGDDRIAGCAYSANSAKAYCDFLLTGIYIAGHEEHEGFLIDEQNNSIFSPILRILRDLRGELLRCFR